ncbi:MAG TPA: hypothetical protein PLW68_06235 [Casimicrobiaceae bacterium]|nr:hypothetical protein [Casimicrobiaceae bacterium]
MEFSTNLGLTLIALLLALWAITWARRAAIAAERTAVAAEKSALAAERSAMAARRGAEAAEASAVKAVEAASEGAAQSADPKSLGDDAWLDVFATELIDNWPKEASAWPLVERNPGLGDHEVQAIIRRAFHLMGRTEAEARHQSVAVLNMRREHQS